MLSLSSVLRRSKNFTSSGTIRMPPAVPLNHGRLPSLDVVAVSQAPSPESNPDSPLPVVTMVGTESTIES